MTHRIAVRTKSLAWREVVVETRPSVRQPTPTAAPAPTSIPPAATPEPRRFRMTRGGDGRPATLEIVPCD